MGDPVADRHRRLIAYLRQNRYASIAELASRLGVSPVTVRRDLRLLAARGLLRRLRGGAMHPAGPELGELAFAARREMQVAEKRAIAAYASTLVRPGEIVALDLGTTMVELAYALKERPDVTVFTASLPVAAALAGGLCTVYLFGGMLRSVELSLIGSVARETVERFRFDRYFMSVAGVDVRAGYTDFNLEEVEVKQALLRQANEVVVLADHTKLGRVSHRVIAPLEAASLLVTDERADEEQVARLAAAGLRVVRAPLERA